MSGATTMMRCNACGELAKGRNMRDGRCPNCEVDRLRDELAAMTRERDDLIESWIIGWGYLKITKWDVMGPDRLLGSFRSHDEAVAAVRKAAGLTEEPR